MKLKHQLIFNIYCQKVISSLGKLFLAWIYYLKYIRITGNVLFQHQNNLMIDHDSKIDLIKSNKNTQIIFK